MGFVATGTYKAPAADSSCAAPKKGGPGYLAIKRAFDIVFSAGVCAVLLIPVATACVAIEIDTPGKPFFRQERIGKNGKPIYIFKLRTMVSDAHDHPEKYMTSEQLAQWKREQKVDDDPRITRVGRFLRRTSLDELPQFINVLTGGMSIVGPRPHAVAHNEQYRQLIEGYMLRHKVKPGITGWAQINGWRGETDTLEKMEKRVEFDLEYIREWSVWFDIKIVFLTVFKGFVNKAAY